MFYFITRWGWRENLSDATSKGIRSVNNTNVSVADIWMRLCHARPAMICDYQPCTCHHVISFYFMFENENICKIKYEKRKKIESLFGPSVTCWYYACLYSLDSEYQQSRGDPGPDSMWPSWRDQTLTSPRWYQREGGAHPHCCQGSSETGGSSHRHSDQMSCPDSSPHGHGRSTCSSYSGW